MRKLMLSGGLIAGAALTAALAGLSAQADPFDAEDVEEWQEEYMTVVADGRAAFTDPSLGTNGVVCAQCHPNGTNVHPETYPKYQQQLGRVVVLAEMVNWCIENPLEGEPLALDDPRMVAIQAYVAHERRGVELAPGKH
ncbi:cytochrome C [Pacificimonas flava]|uniref:Cytochrome C n=2 Tax=Pacificimonas TaxID=1960290 RepID=A0A219B1L8_9SPHN|nr:MULTISPECIES: hypothetical protein [Pacificimonas]MBZ6380045.1 hypothetical protein [Pacificimonas aurantium]OWV32016.1 cytochrome C [Pacificimonas flava]